MAKQKTATKRQRELVGLLKDKFQTLAVPNVKMPMKPFVDAGMEFLLAEEQLESYRQIRPHKQGDIRFHLWLSEELFEQIEQKVGKI